MLPPLLLGRAREAVGTAFMGQRHEGLHATSKITLVDDGMTRASRHRPERATEGGEGLVFLFLSRSLRGVCWYLEGRPGREGSGPSPWLVRRLEVHLCGASSFFVVER